MYYYYVLIHMADVKLAWFPSAQFGEIKAGENYSTQIRRTKFRYTNVHTKFLLSFILLEAPHISVSAAALLCSACISARRA